MVRKNLPEQIEWQKITSHINGAIDLLNYVCTKNNTSSYLFNKMIPIDT